MVADNDNLEKEVKRIEAQISRFTKELKEAQDNVANMEKALSWLAKEYEEFGKKSVENYGKLKIKKDFYFIYNPNHNLASIPSYLVLY